jgi:hypothetical protein
MDNGKGENCEIFKLWVTDSRCFRGSKDLLSHSAFGPLFLPEHITVVRFICKFYLKLNTHIKAVWPILTLRRET